ncbi:MAG: arabinogalactan endo-1,4-beta-galactosidase [Paludibacteraceae bacterium]|nr:arabinogalactan endo-1,4-beta-galactosidase [Paludibacteraceae bacterium]
MKRFTILATIAALVFVGCKPVNPPTDDQPTKQDSIIDEAPARYVGGDISMLPAYEAANTPYYTSRGEKIPNLLTYLHDTCHWNAARVRLFHTPVIINPDTKTRQGEVQDLAYVTSLGQRIRQAGMTFMLDLHYSDTWADPVKQEIPRAWKTCTKAQLEDSVYHYTRNTLQALVAAGATPDLIQIGNEISYGMLKANGSDGVHPYFMEGEDENWHQFGRYLNAGARAVREVCPKAKIIIHIERTKRSDYCVYFYNKLAAEQVDYDIIGLSYYPFWHGSPSVLKSTISVLRTAFPDKPIQIVETAYYNNYFPTGDKGYDNTTAQWPASESGQNKYLTDLCKEIHGIDGVTGLFYWFPEENGNGGAKWDANNIVIDAWINRGLFHPETHKAFSGLYVLEQFL